MHLSASAGDPDFSENLGRKLLMTRFANSSTDEKLDVDWNFAKREAALTCLGRRR